jgi:hypothetical protein
VAFAFTVTLAIMLAGHPAVTIAVHLAPAFGAALFAVLLAHFLAHLAEGLELVLAQRTVLVGVGAFEHGQAVRRDFLEHDSTVAVGVKAFHHPFDARTVARAVSLALSAALCGQGRCGGGCDQGGGDCGEKCLLHQRCPFVGVALPSTPMWLLSLPIAT